MKTKVEMGSVVLTMSFSEAGQLKAMIRLIQGEIETEGKIQELCNDLIKHLPTVKEGS